jgi:hypothetical protein
MKYLKTFESISYVNTDLEYDIKDIFLSEVDEDRFDLTLVSPYGKDYLICGVSLGEVSFEDDEHEGFRLGEIKDFLLRLKDYLDSNNFTYTQLSIIIHDGMDTATVHNLSEKNIDEINNWYNRIDAPGLLKVKTNIYSPTRQSVTD